MLPDREWREGKQREAISTDISYTGPGEAVRALVCGFASPIRQKRLLLMLQAFIDDSGSEPGGKVFVLAGLLSTASQWEQFSDEWAEICGQEPAIADFHMARAYRIKGGYWGDGTLAELTTRRDAKILALAEVVRKYAVVRVSSGVTWRAYEAAARGKVPPEIDSPYFFLFWYIIQAVARWQEGSGRREKVDFIFDDQGKIGITAVSWYPYFLAAFTDQERSILAGTPIFRHDSDVLPLKAADMCAWYLRREITEHAHHVDRGEAYQRHLAMEVLWDIPYAGQNLEEASFHRMIAAVERVNLSS